MKYMTKYCCRLCGETYYSGCTSNKGVALQVTIELVVGGHSKQIPTPEMINPHNCSNGSIGIADFLGFEAISDESDEETE